MILKDPDSVRLAFEAALQADHEDHVPELTPPDDPMRILWRDIKVMHVIEEQSDENLVKLFNTYCWDQPGELAGIPALIAFEMCNRVDPGWDEVDSDHESL